MPPKSRSSTSTNTLPSNLFKASKSSITSSTNAKKSGATTTVEKKKSLSSGVKEESEAIDLKPFSKLYKESLRRMGSPTHGKMDPIEVILRVFDCQEEFGPVSNLTRIERFERAERMGLRPSKEIGEILRLPQARNRREYQETSFNAV